MGLGDSKAARVNLSGNEGNVPTLLVRRRLDRVLITVSFPDAFYLDRFFGEGRLRCAAISVHLPLKNFCLKLKKWL